jgi:hypothetical protein
MNKIISQKQFVLPHSLQESSTNVKTNIMLKNYNTIVVIENIML